MLIDSLADAFVLASQDSSTWVSLLANIGIWCRVAIGIGLVIFVHELGHFVAAKSFGVKCEKFYVGFDVPIRIGPIKFPRTLGRFTYGETEYGIGIIPLGGYVKMLGQDDDPRKLEEENRRIQTGDGDAFEGAPPQLDPRSFPAKPVWQRMIIISAGVVMNVITGVIFAAIAFGYGVSYSPALVGGVVPGGPAWQAGMEPGGRVVSVGSWSDEQMHFREMRTEIVTEGINHPDKPIDVAIQYTDGVRNFELNTRSRPEQRDFRMIGLSIPTSLKFEMDQVAADGTVAAKVLGDKDIGATIVSIDGIKPDADSSVPSTPIFSHLYSNPSKPVTLDLRRADGDQDQVVIPPQPAKTIGVRYKAGPIVSMIDDGPAVKAGMQVGDEIVRVGQVENPDAYQIALMLVGATDPVSIAVRRGSDDAISTIELEITPSGLPQTLPPNEGISGEIALNSVGFAYNPLPVVAAVLPQPDDPDMSAVSPELAEEIAVVQPLVPLQIGDELKKVKLVVPSSGKPEWLEDPAYESVYEKLIDGWEFTADTPLGSLYDAIQTVPAGTELRVVATRPPEFRVVESKLFVEEDNRYLYRRGLLLGPSEEIQRADSISQAFALGIKEGRRRFMDVIRFLRMLPQGRINLRHVGGPVAIVNIAKHEAERGISTQLMFLTMLSMNLAILNFLPIPALDGGHMMFLLYELVAGKRANEQLEFRLTVAGLLTLLMLMVVVFANDIIRLL